jgi:hypothetical protein
MMTKLYLTPILYDLDSQIRESSYLVLRHVTDGYEVGA